MQPLLAMLHEWQNNSMLGVKYTWNGTAQYVHSPDYSNLIISMYTPAAIPVTCKLFIYK